MLIVTHVYSTVQCHGCAREWRYADWELQSGDWRLIQDNTNSRNFDDDFSRFSPDMALPNNNNNNNIQICKAPYAKLQRR